MAYHEEIRRTEIMRIVIYPGTFDPIHSGHIDIAERASSLFDKLIFAVAVNNDKKPLFSAEERIDMIMESMQPLHSQYYVFFENIASLST